MSPPPDRPPPIVRKYRRIQTDERISRDYKELLDGKIDGVEYIDRVDERAQERLREEIEPADDGGGA